MSGYWKEVLQAQMKFSIRAFLDTGAQSNAVGDATGEFLCIFSSKVTFNGGRLRQELNCTKKDGHQVG